jgi:hypothetical protein
MNIDDRLEALTQTVELLAAMHKDNESRMQKFSEAIANLGKKNTRLESLVTDIAEGTARLLRVAENHEQRISHLEGD